MGKTFGFGLFGLIFAGLVIGVVSQQAPKPVVQARTPEASLERISQGLRIDRTLPEGQIWPWDNSEIQAWIDSEIGRLDPLVTNATYREMTTDFSIRSRSSNGGSLGLYYQPTYEAVNMLWNNDPEKSDAGLFILLHMAKANDAWAYYNLGNWVADTSYGPEHIALDLYREAADREFLPSIVNLVIGWETGRTATREEHEAYMRYGYDLGVSDGRWNLTNALAIYYIYDHPTYESGGYLDRAMITLRDEYGEVARYHEDMGIRLDDGIDIPQDRSKAAQEFIRAVELGATWPLNRIGYKYMGGAERGLGYDKDMARDYLHACIVLDPSDYCAMNYGSLYNTPSRNSVDYAIAHAFYRLGAEMDGENKRDLLAEIQSILPHMSTSDVSRANQYYEGMAHGNFAGIPHVQHARQVTP